MNMKLSTVKWCKSIWKATEPEQSHHQLLLQIHFVPYREGMVYQEPQSLMVRHHIRSLGGDELTIWPALGSALGHMLSPTVRKCYQNRDVFFPYRFKVFTQLHVFRINCRDLLKIHQRVHLVNRRPETWFDWFCLFWMVRNYGTNYGTNHATIQDLASRGTPGISTDLEIGMCTLCVGFCNASAEHHDTWMPHKWAPKGSWE